MLRTLRLLGLAAACAGTLTAAPSGQAPDLSDREARRQLEAGNERFASGQPLRPHQDEERRSRLGGAEKPLAAVLACAEAQAVPEIVFDQGLGDLFVVRNSGPAAGGAAAQASLEHAVRELGVRLVVLLTHEGCGVSGGPARRARRQDEYSLPALEGAGGRSEAAAEAGPAPGGAEARARRELRELMRRGSLLQDRVDLGELSVQAAVYSPASGRVRWVAAAAPRPDDTPRGWRRAKDGAVEWSQVVASQVRAARGIPAGMLNRPVLTELGASLEDSGLRVSDVLTAFNGEELSGLEQLDELESQVDPGSEVPARAWRRGARVEAQVKVLRIDRLYSDLAPGEPRERNLAALGLKLRFLQGAEARSRGYQRCLLVQAVTPGKPAARAGLAPGDLLLKCDLFAEDRPFQMAPRIITRVRRGGRTFAVTLRK